MDVASVVGTVLGVLAIAGGQILEGGHLGQIFQFTAALIVVGGTAGATLNAFPLTDIRRAIAMVPQIYNKQELDLRPVIEEIVRIAMVARKEGILSVEAHRASIQNEMFRRAIKYVIDGLEPATVRQIIEADIELAYEQEENAAKVFEAAGGYAPTIGIIGAVLGLIHVMSMLNDPSKIGEGIAVAFVATLYGVGLANLVLLPWSNKLKRKAQQRVMAKEVVKLGVIAIQEGEAPNFLQQRLEVFVEEGLRTQPKMGVVVQ